jgi:hypothetical protein
MLFRTLCVEFSESSLATLRLAFTLCVRLFNDFCRYPIKILMDGPIGALG